MQRLPFSWLRMGISMLVFAASAGAVEFTVAPDGVDDGPGTAAQPFRTVARARDAVRELPADTVGDITVNIRAGDYRLTEPLILTEADSGRNGFSVIYRSRDGIGKARLLGSRLLRGWTRHRGRVWRIDLGQGTVCHTLYENGVRARKARHPNHEHMPDLPCAAGPYLVSSSGSPELAQGVRESWLTWRPGGPPPVTAAGAQLKINVFPWGKCDWHRWICAVTGVDTGERRIIFDNQGDRTRIGDRARYFLEDDLSLLDARSEFFLDEAEGVLYYSPMGDGHPDRLNIALPVARDLIRIEGESREKRAHHVRVEGLAFAETDGLSPARFWWQFGWGRTDHAMVGLRNTDHIEIRNCHLRNSGRNGILMVGENRHNLVTGCWVEHMGVNGVTLSNRFRSETGTGPTADRLEHNILTNNKIHDVGQLAIYNACVNLMNGSNNEVSHSEFFNSPRYATTMRGNTNMQKGEPGWHGNLPPAAGNRFHHLRIHHCGQDSGDMGAVHTASVNIPSGDCVNTFEQITITDVQAAAGMKDIRPDGIFLDWPKRSMHQVFRNIHVLRAQNLAFRTNGADNRTSAVLENVSWEPGFDSNAMAYARIGLQADFPGEYGGPPRPLGVLPAPRVSAAAPSHRRVELQWALPRGSAAGRDPVYKLFRNNALIHETRTGAFVDTPVEERTAYRYHVTVRDGDFGPESEPSGTCEVRTPPDTTPPTLGAVAPSGDLTRLFVRFSEPVAAPVAADSARYRIVPDATVTAAAAASHADAVVLNVAGLARLRKYELHVTGVTDASVARNAVPAGTSLTFTTGFLIAHCAGVHASVSGCWRLHGGATWGADRQGLVLNGRDSYVAGPAEINLGSGDFTLSAWLWKTKGGNMIVAAKGNGFGAANEWSWGWEDPQRADNIAFRCNNRYFATAPGALPPETWVHVAFVKTGATGLSYVNGAPSGGPHDLSELGDLTNTRPLFVGRRRHEPTPAWYDGRIVDLRLYGRALAAQELHRLAESRPGRK